MLLAYEMNGAPLLPQHGYPLRLVAPGWYGMAHVKWLRDIGVVDTPFTGFPQAVASRLRVSVGDPGEPVTRICPRALLIPPGYPDFMSRTRIVRPGDHLLEGRAWSGRAPLTAVEVSSDGGLTWQPATVEERANHPWAWRRFTFPWRATPGRHTLSARAHDGSRQTQAAEQAWNQGGFANNAIQLIPAVCLS
jgi:DMSO/TMAO reductase YedYZ molybdopterin-dependent catalytic subunit